MKLNIFKRISDLEAKLELSIKNNERVINELKTAASKLEATLKGKKPRKTSTEKQKAYARAYYAKKKAQKKSEPKGIWQSPEYEHKGEK